MIKKVLITSMVGLCGLSLMVIGYLNESGKQDVVEIPSTKQIEGQNKTDTTTTNTISTTTKKTTKKVVKTTKKTTAKKTMQKVATASRNEYIAYAKNYSGFDDTQMNCLIQLWDYESGWNPNNVNTESGACGIPQALPCKKIKNYRGNNNWKSQIEWGVDYIKVHKNYGTPCKALEKWKKRSPHWY